MNFLRPPKCQILVYGAALFCQERGPEPTQFGLWRDQVFRLQICLLLENYYISCLLHLGRHQDLNMFQIFSGPWGFTVLLCRVVKIVACPALVRIVYWWKEMKMLTLNLFWWRHYTSQVLYESSSWQKLIAQRNGHNGVVSAEKALKIY